jgi:hypothetical protein
MPLIVFTRGEDRDMDYLGESPILDSRLFGAILLVFASFQTA